MQNALDERLAAREIGKPHTVYQCYLRWLDGIGHKREFDTEAEATRWFDKRLAGNERSQNNYRVCVVKVTTETIREK